MIYAAVLGLVAAGYAGFSDLRIAAAIVGLLAMGAWALFAARRPAAALPLMVSMLLLAGTKFRMRDPTASLDGALDAQVMLELGLFACIAAGLFAVWLMWGSRHRVTAGEAAIGAYVGVALISILWSEALSLSVVRGAQLSIVAALAIVAARTVQPHRALWLAIGAVTVHVILCTVLTLVIPAADGVTSYEDPDRFRWFAVHPIDVGSLAGLGALGLLSVALFSPAGYVVRLAGIPVSFFVPVLSGVLVMASTRSALISFIAAVGALLLLRLHGTIRWPVALTAAAAAMLAVAIGPSLQATVYAAASDYPLLDRVFFRGQDAYTVLELNGRLDLWMDLQPVIVSHFWTGFGYQASREALLNTAFWASYAHNAFLQTMIDLGVFGMTAVLAIVALIVRGIVRADLPVWPRAAVAALGGFLLINAMSTESFAAAPGFDALVLFLCALVATSR